jgi:VanZ family protein
MIKKIIKLVLVLIVMFTIFRFSSETDVKSSKRSDGLIIRTTELILNRKLTSNEKEIYLEKYVPIVRKTAHFTLYFLLGLTFISFLKEFNIDSKKLLLYTVLFVFIYACSDEIHQLFVHGRSGEILDVLIDTMGGFTSSFIYKLFTKRNKHIIT